MTQPVTVNSRSVSTPQRPEVSSHLNYLDGLRAVAALYVLVHHVAIHLPVSARPVQGWYRLLASVFYHGHVAVGLFIVLSGYCLMLPVVRGEGYIRGGAWGFFQKRARRILPPYYSALALSLLLSFLLIGRTTGTHWDGTLPVTSWGVISHLLLVQDLFRDTFSKINHVFWSISVEWRIYFLFPLLVAGWRRFGPWSVTLLTLLVSYGLVFALRDTQFIGATPQYLALFTLGMLSAGIVFARQGTLQALRETLPWLPLTAGFTLLTLALGLKFKSESPLSVAASDLCVGLWASCLLVLAARPGNNRVRTLLEWQPLVFIGTFAYSIYLTHAPLVQLVWQYIVQPLHLNPLGATLALGLLTVPLALGLAYGFFWTCERPFMAKKSPKTLAQAESAAVVSPAP